MAPMLREISALLLAEQIHRLVHLCKYIFSCSIVYMYSILGVLHAKEVVFFFQFGNCPKKMTLGRGTYLA